MALVAGLGRGVRCDGLRCGHPRLQCGRCWPSRLGEERCRRRPSSWPTFAGRKAGRLRRPPLSCRTSPPQGGRSAGAAVFRQFATVEGESRQGRQPISPLRGPAGQRGARGNAIIPITGLQRSRICIYISPIRAKRKLRMIGQSTHPAKVWRNARLATLDPRLGGLGIVEDGAVAAPTAASPLPARRPSYRTSRRHRRDRRLRGPLDHARPDRLPHPSRPCRRPRRRVRAAAGGRDLRGDRARRRRHRLHREGDARGRARTSSSRKRSRASMR